MRLARRFNGGKGSTSNKSPKGTAEMFCNQAQNPGLKGSAVPCGDLVVDSSLPAVETAGYYDPSRVAGLALREADPVTL
jgi:hypothetical protein